MMVELQGKELQQRLSLFQVFLKLYEQHGSLLDDILQLENLTQTSLATKQGYIQGVIDGCSVYVITNLCDNKTQSLQQPQQIWTIGRDESNGIYIADRYLSDRHAAIQYIEHQGFYLIDFKSTNGSFVNGEPVYKPTKLNDGDRIRLGMITFNFFINHSCRNLPSVAVELLMQLVPGMDNPISIFHSTNEQQRYQTDIIKDLNIVDNLDNLKSPHSKFSAEEKSEILDRFFSRHQRENLEIP
ncbi:FHA domain-containing protein [Calothrix sp. NIES-2098]|nr:FHA domain-containing protein [Calothrix sp. NIES-2098]